jgi:dTDP-glucose pyrophosphorylase
MNTHDSTQRLAAVAIAPSAPISDALRHLDRAGTGALVLCDDNGKLCGLLTDGDIRRAFLRGVSFDSACRQIATLDPIVANPNTTPAEFLSLMRRFDVNHVPVVDDKGVAVDLIVQRDVVHDGSDHPEAVIMAGGYGKRLHPLTENTPKPLLPVGDRPLMEITLEQLRKSGIRRINVTTHYLAESITDHFGDGSAFGVELKYVTETQPLGTVGGLKLLKEFCEPLLVINGDILTGVNFRDVLSFHREHRADMTVGVRRQEIQIPYGVMECHGPFVRSIREKPKWDVLVNAGIYILEPAVYRFIPSGQRFDMTDLMQRLLDAGRTVVSFPIMEYWLDIGHHHDYAKAQEDFKHARI